MPGSSASVGVVLSIEAVFNGLETLLEAVTGFAAASVTQNDYTALNKGVSKAMVIRYGGSVDGERGLNGTVDMTHIALVEVYERYKNPADTENDLRDDTQLITTRIHQYPKLNGVSGMQWAFVRGITETEPPHSELVNQPNRWRMRTVEIEMREHDTQAYLE